MLHYFKLSYCIASKLCLCVCVVGGVTVCLSIAFKYQVCKRKYTT